MQTPKGILEWLLFCTIAFSACSNLDKTANSSAPSTQDVWENAVVNAANNEERLHRMLQGTYVRYSYRDRKTNRFVPWKVNDGQDSVIYYIKPIGDPNKNGYCLLHCLVMTHLPDRPLVTYVSKIKQITRDSLVLKYYAGIEATLGEIIDGTAEKEINFSNLNGDNATSLYSYVKESNQQFRLSTTRKKYGIGNDPKRVFYQSFGQVNFAVHHEDAVFYDKDQEKTEVAFNHDKRLFDFDLKVLLKSEE